MHLSRQQFDDNGMQVLPASAAHRMLCTMREDVDAGESSGSAEEGVSLQQQLRGDAFNEGAPLIDVTFKAHSPHEAMSNPRVPQGVTAVRSFVARCRILI